MAKWLTGTILKNKRWNGRLSSLIIDAPLDNFESGQFLRVGLEIGDEIIARPYSLVNTAADTYLEVYFNIVEQGPLSPLLFKLEEGDNILVSSLPSGFLTISEIPECKHLWMMATGTGVGPFLSILKAGRVWSKFEKTVLCYSVRTRDELAYCAEIKEILNQHSDQFIFIPAITREKHDDCLNQRFPQTLISGAMEDRAGIQLNAENSHVMMCGSTNMITDVSNVLKNRGMKKHRRRDPGHFTTEKYH